MRCLRFADYAVRLWSWAARRRGITCAVSVRSGWPPRSPRNQVNAERAKTTAAAQEVLTNEQKRLAAEKLAGMAPPDLRIAIANCVNKMAESGQSLNCYPIGGNALPTIAVPNPGQ